MIKNDCYSKVEQDHNTYSLNFNENYDVQISQKYS